MTQHQVPILQQALQELGLQGDFVEYTPADIAGVVNYAADATEITKFEGGNFSLLKKDKHYFLKKGENLVGWVTLGYTTFNDQPYYAFELIYILPQYRQTKATLLLVYGVKELLNHPVIVDGALFTKGKELLTGLHARDRFKISTVDKKTGEKKPFHPSDLSLDTSKNFVVVEALGLGLYMEGTLPGNPTHRLYFEVFPHLHDIEM